MMNKTPNLSDGYLSKIITNDLKPPLVVLLLLNADEVVVVNVALVLVCDPYR